MRMRSIWIGARALVLLSFVFSQARTSSAHQERVPDSLQVQTALASGKPFSFEEHGKTTWLKKPTGERIFSLGVCVVGMGARCSSHSSRGARHSKNRIRVCRSVYWRDSPPRHGASRPSQCELIDSGNGHIFRRGGAAFGRGIEFRRPWRSAAGSVLGTDDC